MSALAVTLDRLAIDINHSNSSSINYNMLITIIHGLTIADHLEMDQITGLFQSAASLHVSLLAFIYVTALIRPASFVNSVSPDTPSVA